MFFNSSKLYIVLNKHNRLGLKKIAQYISFCGYVSSRTNASLFIKKDFKVHVLVLLYVNNKIITGNDEQEIYKLKDELAIRFEMKNLGNLRHFLGLDISMCKKDILVSQGQYAKRSLRTSI